MARLRAWAGGIAILSGILLASCGETPTIETGKLEQAQFKRQVLDEAQLAGPRFPHAGEDYFHDMDNGVSLSPEEIKGRNMWLVWTGGDDRLWDGLTGPSFGTFDLLKIVTSHPSQKYCYGQQCDRDSRWRWLGAVNETCFDKPAGPDPDRFDLWLDVRSQDCPPDPFENEAKYPGVKIGARGKPIGGGKVLPIGSYYGYATGILGLRLFPNPAFDEKAMKDWDAEKYYTVPDYYNNPKLVRPYRVGMSCGFCHAGPSPIHPPADPANPQFSNLNSSVGAQYLWMDRVFVYSGDEKNFLYQLVHSYPPGTMDTSLVSTDYINNPRSMNAVYSLRSRLEVAKNWGKETLKGGELLNKQFPGTFDPPDTSWSPRVLKDGADSVGVLGALNRVYLNIGVYSEEWLTHFNPFFGGKEITPIRLKDAQENSAYWRATEEGTPDMAKFFLKAAQPDRLKDAPGGEKYLTADEATLVRGKTVFAETCARCHSSKLPDIAWKALDPGGCSGPDYLKCWKRYWDLTKQPEFKEKMKEIVAAPDFLEGNYLSTDARIPVTLLRTNACSPLGTNAIRGNIWDNFSSQTYKDLPPAGTITVQDPFTGERRPYEMPGGGLGFTRVPSLISVWSTAPLLLNNQLGPFDENPSVESRMGSFQQSIEQLLWPERRRLDPGFDGFIVRTTERSMVLIPKRDIPGQLSSLFNDLPDGFTDKLKDPISRIFDKDGNFEIGPVPKGFPLNVASYRPLADIDGVAARARHKLDFGTLLLKLAANLPLPGASASDEDILAWLANLREPLLKLSKCPDFVVNRGHYFGTAKFNETEGLSEDEKSFGEEPPLSDDDKRALIEFMKTF
ncbi:MAG: hypothetical protein L0Y50_03160 [Beijerinckiaceae bacterium]|nr:hypothetical protein [Beijerinckiaceae bacterium]MCI0735265.1 hypothetical protein [Beijerinckiaceae bacterium]